MSGDEKSCLVNQNSDKSYGELHFTDNQGNKHILIRGKDKYNSKNNILTLDGKKITQPQLTSFYKDKKLFLSIINPLYFLNKKPAEQKELVDSYLSDVSPKEIFDSLNQIQQQKLIDKYFHIKPKEIYDKLSKKDLKTIFSTYNLNGKSEKSFDELSDIELKYLICENIDVLKDSKYYQLLDEGEKTEFINLNMFNIYMDIAYNTLSEDEQKLLDGIPNDIPTYISELNSDIKQNEKEVTNLEGQIEYAKSIANKQVPEKIKFEKEQELSLARQELEHLISNKVLIKKESQKEIVESLEKQKLNKETEINNLGKIMQAGKIKYESIKNSEVAFCPTCEQKIENTSKIKALNNIRTDLFEKYDKQNSLKTELKDIELKLAMERCKFHALDGTANIENSKRIKVVEENIKALELEQQEIQNHNNKIDIELNEIEHTKANINALQIKKEAFEKNINQTKEAKKVVQKLYITYIEEKMKLAKRYLKDVNIQFYSVLKTTGEVKDDFIITYKTKPLSDLSRSETVATSLEFANMFNKISRLNGPIFIDDYESCVDYDFIKEYSGDTQVLVSTVQKGQNLEIKEYIMQNTKQLKAA